MAQSNKSTEQHIHKTVKLLQQRMKENSDFPALSHTMHIINKQTSDASDASVTELTNTILNDYALSNKLLKLINSVYYSQYQLGERISTISRAVFILGFEQVRNIALTMKLFDHLQNKDAAADVKDNILIAFMSGIISKQIAGKVEIRDKEEVFICSMFYNLGKLLASFYLPEEAKKIKTIVRQKGVDEDTASRGVLGLSYEKLGASIAKGWQFPDQIVTSMHRLPKTKVEKPAGAAQKYQVVTSFSNELSTVINNLEGDPERQRKALNTLRERFDKCFSMDESEIMGLIDASLQEMDEYSKLYSFNMGQSNFINKMSKVSRGEQIDELPEGETIMPSSDTDLDLASTQALDIIVTSGESELSDDPDAILTRGIQDVTNSLLGADFSINDILRMILEIMYRGLKSTRALICIKDTRTPTMMGRFGFGADIDKVVSSFQFKIGDSQDVFNVALSKESDIFLKDINEPRIRNYIPEWYRKALDAETFIVFPLIINNVPVGMIYADNTNAGKINIPPQQLTLLKTLRNQAVMAIKQSL